MRKRRKAQMERAYMRFLVGKVVKSYVDNFIAGVTFEYKKVGIE